MKKRSEYTQNCLGKTTISRQDMRVMEAEIQTTATRVSPVIECDWRDIVFSITEARRALPYISRVARDATAAYRQLLRCRCALDEPMDSVKRSHLLDLRDEALHRLDEAIDECNAVGADLVDFYRGVVRMRGEVNGRNVSLIWRLDEPVAEAWKTIAR